jgi:hypothetical protein
VQAVLRAIAAAIVLASAAVVTAQPAEPATCAACARGDQLIAQFSLEPLRAIAAELTVPLDDPLSTAEFARIIEQRKRTPALLRLGAVEDADLALIAAALCRAASGACVDATTRGLRCAADRCEVALPPADPSRADLLRVPENCHQYSTRNRTPQLGVGVDTGAGWQRSRHPVDGRVWSFGIEARARVARRFGIVARVDRSKGRDLATDTGDGDGNDDQWTGSVTRLTALAGPTIAFDIARFERTRRFLRLDLLGGYLSTSSQAAETGPAAGVDLAFQLSIFRIGARFVQGFGDARDASMALVHIGFLAGSAPLLEEDGDCGAEASSRPTRLALGFDMPMFGYGFSSELGLLTPSLGFEALWHLTPKLDAIARADMLYFPGYERERAIHQALLAGMRIDHGRRKKTGWFTTLMTGYSQAAGLTPTTGSGLVGDLSLGWGIQAEEGAAYLRMHGRFGVSPDNTDYRALFISGGFEIRLDPKRWRDRG